MNNDINDEDSFICNLPLRDRAEIIVGILDRLFLLDNESIIIYLIDLNNESRMLLAEQIAEIYTQKLTTPQLKALSDYLISIGSNIALNANNC